MACNSSVECTCSYTTCARFGKCCECVAYHKAKDQIPACYFPKNIEATGERSISAFVKLHSK